MKRILATALLAMALPVVSTACGGKGESTTPADESVEAPSPEGKRWGGWRWKGKRDDCFFLVDNRCFSDLEKACRAAKCKGDTCRHDDSAPANVSCKK